MKLTTPKSEKLSPIDNVWWNIDRPNNNAIITGVLVFDGQLSLDNLKSLIEERLLNFPRFTQYVEVPSSSFKTPRWVVDEHFDISNHLKIISSSKPKAIPKPPSICFRLC